MGTIKVLLISMPWASIHRPSLALGVLTAAAELCEFPHQIDQLSANVRWVEYIKKESDGKLGAKEFTQIADNYFLGAGEWIFTNALYSQKEWKVKEFVEFAKEQGVNSEHLIQMHKLALNFITDLANEIVNKDYDIIGFSSSFLQNVPSLALAKKVKELAPDKLIAFGGANCDGVQGVTLHKNFPFVDFVARGEGERAFMELLDTLETNSPLNKIAGICWRNSLGESIVNEDTAAPVNMNNVPAPIYLDYFKILESSGLSREIEPELILEASRGCWWGQKHQCTFCGLNGSFIDYRSKSPEKFLSELESAVKRYRVLDVSLADNILDMKYYKTLLPKLAELDWDLRMFVEIKANITREQVAMLRKAGFLTIQPGIESLNSRVLRIMDKGVKGIHNIRLLRDCKSEGVAVTWNYLYGFPEESPKDYSMIIKQLPSLVHLIPPMGATRVALERFSPFFNKPEMGMDNLGPSKVYSYIYNLPDEELKDLVYVFESSECGIKGTVEQNLHNGIRQWHNSHKGSTLNYIIKGQNVVILDRRKNWKNRNITLKKGGKLKLIWH
ncbi:RiPP maturation radical SAM protein 1 [Rossellomorea vietnamensis]|uniref:RiPP maturation radical SAM protein 1 n=1 Tax=Rossellomorea vietnamensis TaxID=218284 RepID=A0A6I6UCX6_9BACI|nr:RiPP maturation radical SAM C-methyltransferase [Rossellomorea vietnamensis]QHE59788.1 RiPP maturation radical SAM protein 1 [Rossellomorea vietnamensis]